MLRLGRSDSRIRALAFTDCGRALGAFEGDWDSVFRLQWWDARDGTKRGSVRFPYWSNGLAVAMDADPELIATVGYPLIRLTDAAGTKIRSIHTEHRIRPTAIALTPDGRRLATACPQPIADGAGSEIAVLPLPDPTAGTATYRTAVRVALLAFAPTGRFLASFGNMQLTVWDLDAGESILAVSAIPVRRLAFAPDGLTLAVATGDLVRLWDLSGRERAAFSPVAGSPVAALAYAPDGRTLAAGAGGAVAFADADNGTAVRTFDWGIGAVSAIAFAPTGLTCAAASEQGEVVVWDLV